MSDRLEVWCVTGLPEFDTGDDVGAAIAGCAPGLADGDVVVVTSKAVSKAEGRLVPGTARIAPIETTGLLGGKTTTSVSSRASTTPGAGRASAAPTTSKPVAAIAARSSTHHCWKCTRRPSTRSTCVSIGVSVAGSSCTPGCQR